MKRQINVGERLSKNEEDQLRKLLMKYTDNDRYDRISKEMNLSKKVISHYAMRVFRGMVWTDEEESRLVEFIDGLKKNPRKKDWVKIGEEIGKTFKSVKYRYSAIKYRAVNKINEEYMKKHRIKVDEDSQLEVQTKCTICQRELTANDFDDVCVECDKGLAVFTSGRGNPTNRKALNQSVNVRDDVAAPITNSSSNITRRVPLPPIPSLR